MNDQDLEKDMAKTQSPPEEQTSFIYILDEYTRWFADIIRHLFYTDDEDQDFKMPVPGSFEEWLKAAQQSGADPEEIKRLRGFHRDMIKQAEKTAARAAKINEAPRYEDFNAFVRSYESFISQVGRAADQGAESGRDTLTGLKDAVQMEEDLKTEMERLARKGMAFCLALVRLDRFEALHSSDAGQAAEAQKMIADLLHKNIRSFDDGYVLEDGYFLVSLKQTDISGGLRAVQRLRQDVNAQDVSYVIKGNPAPLSVSAYVAEPTAGDDLAMLLQHLKSDLERLGGEEDVVLEYTEISPLERYVKEEGHV